MRLERLIIVGVFIAAIVLISISLYAVSYTATPVQYWDQWEMVKHLANGGGPSLSYLLAKHNEHIILTSKTIFFLDYIIFEYSNISLVFAVVFLQIAIAFYIAKIATYGRQKFCWLLFTVFSAIMLSLSQWENLTVGFQTQFGLTTLFAIFVCSSTQQYLNSNGTFNRLVIPVFFSVAATILSMGNGITIIISQVLLLIANRANWPKALIVSLSYLLPMTIFLQEARGVQAASIFENPNVFAILKFLVAVIGSSFSSSYDFAAVYGAIVLGIFAALAISHMLLSALVKRQADSQILTLIAIGTFPIMSALAVTYGRYTLGDAAALSSRYSALNLLLYCCVIGLIYRVLPAARAGHAAIACGALGVVIAGTTSIRTENIVQLETRSNNLRQASYLALAGARDDGTLNVFYPDASAIRPALDYLRDHKLNIFSPRHGLTRPAAPSATELTQLPSCKGVSISGTARLQQNLWIATGTIDNHSDISDAVWLISMMDNGTVTGFAPPSFQWRGWRALFSNRSSAFRLPIQINGENNFDKAITIVVLRNNGTSCRVSDTPSLPRLYFQSQFVDPKTNLEADVQRNLDGSGALLPSVLQGTQSLERPGMLSTWQGSDKKTGSVT